MAEQDTSTRQVSPRYPSQSLKPCIDAIRKLFAKDGKMPIERDIAAKHLGYKGISGASAQTLASLNYFGLLEQSGNGKVRLSDLGLAIIHPDNDEELVMLLEQALGKPKVFTELLERIGNPRGTFSDENITNYLIREKGFRRPAAEECVQTFRDSINFYNESIDALKRGTHDSRGAIFTPTQIGNNTKSGDESEERPSEIGSEDNEDQMDEIQRRVEIIPIKLSGTTRAEIRVIGPIGLREAKKLKVWMEKVVSPWVDLMLDEMEDEEVNL